MLLTLIADYVLIAHCHTLTLYCVQSGTWAGHHFHVLRVHPASGAGGPGQLTIKYFLIYSSYLLVP